MIKAFSARAWEDYQHWVKDGKNTLNKLNGLINEAVRTPESGTGRPEALKGELEGYWSRRINKKDRLVYKIITLGSGENALFIAQCRHHYTPR